MSMGETLQMTSYNVFRARPGKGYSVAGTSTGHLKLTTAAQVQGTGLLK